MSTEEKKRCGNCHEYKPLSDYHKSSQAKDGRQGWCKACSTANAKLRALGRLKGPRSQHATALVEARAELNAREVYTLQHLVQVCSDAKIRPYLRQLTVHDLPAYKSVPRNALVHQGVDLSRYL